jgi:hypothetical protein
LALFFKRPKLLKICAMPRILPASVFALFLLNTCNAQEIQTSSAIFFRENKGQVCDQNYKQRPDVLYSGICGNMNFHLKQNGISYQFCRVDSWKKKQDKSGDLLVRKVPDKVSIYRLDIDWLNVNEQAEVTSSGLLNDVDNFYLAQCPDGITGVRSYSSVLYKGLYKGIDLHYYQKDGDLKYDLILQPGADYKGIQFKISGAEKISKDKLGNILIETPFGQISEGSPLVYQAGKKLQAEWIITADRLSYSIPYADPSLPLLIDPVVRVWGTYYGGTNADGAQSCVSDPIGNLYVAGNSSSSNGTVIATTGSHQTTMGGTSDSYLAKFTSSGVRLWGTYCGGTDIDNLNNCAIYGSNDIYICGSTASLTAIATTGTQQLNYGGGAQDAFLVKFNSNGIRQWGTYYGGTGEEQECTCTIDGNGNVFVGGVTTIGTGLTTTGCHQSTFGGSYDGFLAKFNSNGLRQWGTYYGGTGGDYLRRMASDAAGNVYCTGLTTTTTANVISTIGSHQPVHGGGTNDAFLVKFNSAGSRLWGTYYGGTVAEYGWGCCLDDSGNVYICGESTSNNAIATPGCHQPVKNAFGDCYLAKFTPSGIRLWATYYGANLDDVGNACCTDNAGSVYMCGTTTSTVSDSSISTPGSHQYVYGGNYDAFLVKFSGNGIRQWGTFYGGVNPDGGFSCDVNLNGMVHMVGETQNATQYVISSTGSHQPLYAGNGDSYIVQFFDCANSDVTFTFAAGDTLCLYSPPVTITGGYPGGGTYTGNAVYNGIFYPDSALLGWNLINYTKSFSTNCTDYALDSVYIDLCFTDVQGAGWANELEIFPNPVYDQLFIKDPSARSKRIILYNLAGELIYDETTAKEEIIVNTEMLPEGFYLLKISSEQGVVCKKIVRN